LTGAAVADLPSLNPALQRIRQGQLAVGMIVRIVRTPDIVAIAKSSGHDFLFLDLQNGPFSPEAVADIALAGLGVGIPSFVRVSSVFTPDVERYLNLGATGVIFADVRTADDATAAVKRCRFEPMGSRGVSGSFPHFGYRNPPLAEAKKALEENTLVAVMIESAEGMRNLKEIASVPGIDVMHLGANDLLSSLGHPGAFDKPVMQEMAQQLIDVCRKCGKIAGIGGDKVPARQRDYISRGARFITAHSDLGYLMGSALERVSMLRRSD
jgi:2-keto-3-deoxy-L-rhamnonate aldolase RhmA